MRRTRRTRVNGCIDSRFAPSGDAPILAHEESATSQKSSVSRPNGVRQTLTIQRRPYQQRAIPAAGGTSFTGAAGTAEITETSLKLSVIQFRDSLQPRQHPLGRSNVLLPQFG